MGQPYEDDDDGISGGECPCVRSDGEYWRESIGGALRESQDEPLPGEGLHRFEASFEKGALDKVVERC